MIYYTYNDQSVLYEDYCEKESQLTTTYKNAYEITFQALWSMFLKAGIQISHETENAWKL